MSKQRPLMSMIAELQSDIKVVTHDNVQHQRANIRLLERIERLHSTIDYWQSVSQTLTEENARCSCGNQHAYAINGQQGALKAEQGTYIASIRTQTPPAKGVREDDLNPDEIAEQARTHRRSAATGKPGQQLSLFEENMYTGKDKR